MITVLLYGELGKLFGRRHRFDIASPAEAVRALTANFPEFGAYLRARPLGQFRVFAGKTPVGERDLRAPVSEREAIKIVPVVAGAGGMGQIVLGAALMIGAPYLAALAPAAMWGAATSAITSIGMSLVLGGVSQMLFKPPTQQGPSERPDNKPSYLFNGAVNTVAQGNAVPVMLGGPMIVGSQVISTGLSVEQIAA